MPIALLIQLRSKVEQHNFFNPQQISGFFIAANNP
jgi:hypothetical protein